MRATFALATLALAACAGNRPVPQAPAGPAKVRVTWQREEISECSLLGYVRAIDRLRVKPDGNMVDWEERILQRRGADLGGDTVLRLPSPQQAIRFGEEIIAYTAPPDDETTIGAVYRCGSSGR